MADLESGQDVDVKSFDAALPAGTNDLGRVGHNVSGISSDRKVVTTAGTAEAIASTTTAKFVQIQAELDNTGIIAVGGSGVVAAAGTREGIALEAGDVIGLPIDDLADVFIDSTVDGEGVTFTYLT